MRCGDARHHARATGRGGRLGPAARHQAAEDTRAADARSIRADGAHAPFVQFTYAVMPPIPKALTGVSTEASERIWMNVPPARVWVYRKD